MSSSRSIIPPLGLAGISFACVLAIATAPHLDANVAVSRFAVGIPLSIAIRAIQQILADKNLSEYTEKLSKNTLLFTEFVSLVICINGVYHFLKAISPELSDLFLAVSLVSYIASSLYYSAILAASKFERKNLRDFKKNNKKQFGDYISTCHKLHSTRNREKRFGLHKPRDFPSTLFKFRVKWSVKKILNKIFLR